MNLPFNPLEYSHLSKRNIIYGTKGMVATSQPLAAQIGIDILKQGGNAIDAAIATAVAMTVLEPTSNGIGSDAFALIWTNDQLMGLNASGSSPASIITEEFIETYKEGIPKRGWVPVTVPGAPAAWAELSKRFGKLPFEDLLAPAAKYAEEGFPLSPTTSILWNNAYNQFKRDLTDDCFRPWFDTFAPNGKPPKAGEVVFLKDHANTLKEMGKTHCESFYRGSLAEKIDAYSKKFGGFLRKKDLEEYEVDWVTPISTTYKGYTISEIPPNGHGITALMALNIYENFSNEGIFDEESLHQKIESMKLAFSDAKQYVSDPKFMKTQVKDLLSKNYAKKRANLITEEALFPQYGNPTGSGTIYLCTADSEGNMVSFIQSNYMGFGSGIVIPGTGISLQNRGCNFSLDPNSDNCIAPKKKSYHTIIPGFLSKDQKPIGPFGIMGGFMQPQGHFQLILNLVDSKMNPQQALDAPRWQWIGDMNILIEKDYPSQLINNLISRGHRVKIDESGIDMGRGQMIWKSEEGVLIGATEKRADGYVATW